MSKTPVSLLISTDQIPEQLSADYPDNVPREVLRRRGEVYATFWYQQHLRSKAGIYLIVYIGGNFRYLQSGTASSPVRFERDFISNHNFKTIAHNSPYDTVLGNFTDDDEVTYYLNKVLQLIKSNYENE
jgi:hypothetical protein